MLIMYVATWLRPGMFGFGFECCEGPGCLDLGWGLWRGRRKVDFGDLFAVGMRDGRWENGDARWRPRARNTVPKYAHGVEHHMAPGMD